MKKEVKIGKITIGGNFPIAIQSMTNTYTEDTKPTIKQIEQLVAAGCEIVRLAIPNQTALASFKKIRKALPDIPLVADIHFDYKLAIGAVKAGADKIRINPGNIADTNKLNEIVKGCKERNVPIRVGVNAGSSKKSIIKLAEEYINFFENIPYENIVISVKSSSVPETILAYEQISKKYDHPLHVGITEAGPEFSGAIKSAVGIGAILAKGIGDTIRVSLTADPIKEVVVAKKILQALGLRQFGPDVISCPTCGRTEIDIIKMANEVEKMAEKLKYPIKIAVMGCVVNGPGEAKHADYGIAGGKKQGIIFAHGKVIKKTTERKLVSELFKIIKEEYREKN
ncbi:MAG: flavodoxin-dependent (E)-4-hydroxy-3-methylbut-2-enyl-diphosphate synthase [Candidatus Margulisbacteria bacterium]|nr:flavodoxin-dependent (E)-4-hydroxy-3-methylbut-2-enyl-diphosphate synthase [Candidatus Margulisiibacteriota bacterium]